MYISTDEQDKLVLKHISFHWVGPVALALLLTGIAAGLDSSRARCAAFSLCLNSREVAFNAAIKGGPPPLSRARCACCVAPQGHAFLHAARD